MRTKPLSLKKTKLRVDLHGVSVFGPGGKHKLIRWEWITDIRIDGGIFIRSRSTELEFPEGAFNLSSVKLGQLLEAARSIERRSEVIGRLAAQT